MKYLYIALALLISSCDSTPGSENGDQEVNTNTLAATPAPETDTATAGTELKKPSDIAAIRKAYTQINNAVSTLDSTSFTYTCYEQQGTVTYFAQNDELMLIRQHYGEASHRTADRLYYLAEGDLFFAYYKTLDWVFDSEGGQGATRDRIQEKRYYVIDEEPVQCLQKEYVIRSTAKENPVPENVVNVETDCSAAKELIEDFNKLKKYSNESDTLQCL